MSSTQTDHPYSDVDESLVGCPAHRALAREAAAASTVLLKNSGGALPLRNATGAYGTIAVVGPFADCGECYLHSYHGSPSLIVSPLAALNQTAAALGTRLAYSANDSAAAAGADVTIAVLGLGQAAEHEGFDRVRLGLPPEQAELLRALRRATEGRMLILATVSGGPIALDDSLFDAAVWLGYPGQEAGHGLTDVLWGSVSPSARLPVTVYREDYVAHVGPELDYSMTSGAGRTYRYLNESASTPIYRFGHGLSYSTFSYSALTLTASSGPASVAVSAQVANVGAVAAHEVVQVYVSAPARDDVRIPIRSLQGFARVYLAPGESRRLDFVVTEGQLASVLQDGSKVVTPGSYTFSVGGRQPGDAQGSPTVLGTVPLP